MKRDQVARSSGANGAMIKWRSDQSGAVIKWRSTVQHGAARCVAVGAWLASLVACSLVACSLVACSRKKKLFFCLAAVVLVLVASVL